LPIITTAIRAYCKNDGMFLDPNISTSLQTTTTTTTTTTIIIIIIIVR
jgi:hypothetical protein